jgi:DNA-binding YbaB/EbfC family protein
MNPFDMMKNIKEIQERMQSSQARIQALQVQGTAGGGMLKLTMDGTFRITAVEIDPSLNNPEDFVLLADLMLAASRDAHAKVSEYIQKEMQTATGGMPLPPMFGMGG